MNAAVLQLPPFWVWVWVWVWVWRLWRNGALFHFANITFNASSLLGTKRTLNDGGMAARCHGSVTSCIIRQQNSTKPKAISCTSSGRICQSLSLGSLLLSILNDHSSLSIITYSCLLARWKPAHILVPKPYEA